MKVLILSAAYTGHPGGVARHVVALARGLVNTERIDVHVVTAAKHGDDESKQNRGRLGEWKLKQQTAADFAGRRAIFERVFQPLSTEWRQLKIDVIHAHDFDSLVLGSMLRCAHGVPLVFTAHRAPTSWLPDRIRENAKDCLLEVARHHILVDKIIAPSKASAVALRAQGFEPQVIPHAMTPHLLSFESDNHCLRSRGIPDDRRLVFCPVRADEHKDPMIVLKAAKLLKQWRALDTSIELPLFLLLADDDDPEAQELRRIASAMGLAEGVDVCFTSFFEYGSELATVLRASEIVVVPSLRESFGQSVLDAFMFAKPVLARDSAALPELIQHGRNGLLFETSYDLATRLHRLLRDSEEAVRLGLQGEADNKARYNLDRMIDEYIEMYTQLARTSKGCGE